MKALVYRKSIPRFVGLRLLGGRWRRPYTGAAALVSLREVPAPRLPNQRWVRMAPRLSGICGSDLATVCAKNSPYLGPVTSTPFVLGHEVVGTIAEVGREVVRCKVGDRVVLHPALGCRVRGITPLCPACGEGREALCRNVDAGDIAPGIQTGYCRDTGGGFGESLVAHESQVYQVPPELDDRAAVLIEPFACALHATLRSPPENQDAILVLGCGAIGLLTIAALRAVGSRARILAVAKHDHQRQHALELGADEVLPGVGSAGIRYPTWATALGAKVLPADIGKPTVIGGADVVFDCVASSQSIDDGLRFTRSGGTLVLVGMPGIPWGVDWTPMWFKELSVHAAYAYGPERVGGEVRDTFEIAIGHMRTGASRLTRLVSRPYALSDYRAAFQAAMSTGRSGAVKTVIAVHQGRE